MGRSRNTWHPIIYVSYGILNGFLLYENMDYIRDDPSMAEIIRDIAVINVKKLPGYTRTYDYGLIWNAYNKNKSILLKQIEAYHPAQTQITRDNYLNDIINAVKIWATKINQ